MVEKKGSTKQCIQLAVRNKLDGAPTPAGLRGLVRPHFPRFFGKSTMQSVRDFQVIAA